jgi:hypothetical protein
MAEEKAPVSQLGEATHEVTVTIRAFPYYTDTTDLVTGRPVRQENIARRGDTLKLNDVDYARFQKFSAGVDGGPENVSRATETVPSTGKFDPNSQTLSEATVPDIAEWIKDEHPTVDEVVEEVNNDPDSARKVLEAENLATGQQPRSTLVERLEDIAG